MPPPFFDPNHLFAQLLALACNLLVKAKGIIINSFDYFEHESVATFKNGQVLSDFPLVFHIGPLESIKPNKTMPWLDEKPAKSVVYVCFGTRIPMTRDQIRELGQGLKINGYRFLWVVKTSKFDEEQKKELEEPKQRSGGEGVGATRGDLGTSCHRRKINAEVVEKARLRIWERGRGWGGERLAKEEEIAEKIKEIMTNVKLRNNAKRIGEEARKVGETDGSPRRALMRIIETLWEN
ncbi:hypothetical protein Ancab_034218 [Ancistrocladus abbreviatus]